MRRIICLAIAAFMIPCASVLAQDESYVATPVTISKEKVKFGDGIYYSHVVLEKQTLYSICRAYGVTLQEVYDSNPDLKLETEGLKKNSILRIPVKGENPKADKFEKNDEVRGEGTIHTVKWYEDLEGIAAEYNVTPEAIIEANKGKNDIADGKVKARMKLIIPAAGKSANATVEEKTDTSSVQTLPEEIEDRIAENENGIDAVEEPSMKTELSLALILPFNISAGRGAVNYMDFYSGALLAAKKAGSEGLNVELSIFDDSKDINSLNYDKLSSYDAVIGPVGKENLDILLSKAPENATIVSPLDPRTATLTASHSNLFQACPSTDDQFRDIVEWMNEDRQNGDNILIIAEKSKWVTRNLLDSLLNERSMPHKTFTYSILEGRNIGTKLKESLVSNGTNRVVVASESEAFVNDVIRNLNVALFEQYPITLYGPSKMKGYETIDIANYHNLKLHMSLSYNINYDDAKVKDFLMKYRALYGTEPGNFAFQGYDLATYFIQACSRYGKEWSRYMADETSSLLQSSIRFNRVNETGGYVNTAVRRVIFNPDYSVGIIR